MKKYTIQEIKSRFNTFGFKWFPFHIVGIRSIADKPNEFDDKIYLVIGDVLFEYPATTNPGTFYLMVKNWLNPNGAFILKSNEQYIDCWTFGKHRGKYDALIQCKNLKGYRDGDGDNKSEELGELLVAPPSTGINIHRAAEGIRTWWINNYSAGCQVIADKWADFIKRCQDSKRNFFTYTLLTEW
jgi:hypothetical protein